MKGTGSSAPASPMKEPAGSRVAAQPSAMARTGGGGEYAGVTQAAFTRKEAGVTRKEAVAEAPFVVQDDTLDFVEAVAARFSGVSYASLFWHL